MTVITKPISENKQSDKPQEKPLVVSVNDKAGGDHVETGADDSHLEGGVPDDESSEYWLWGGGAGSRRRRRLSATASLCVLFTAMTLLCGLLFGAVYAYRHFSHTQMSRLRVWCGVPFDRSSLGISGKKTPIFNFQKSPHFPAPFNAKDAMFSEQFDLDLGSNSYEEIYVPDFGIRRDGRFIHDLKKNLTAIVDKTGEKCYVFPFESDVIATPREIFHVLKKIWRTGFYDGNMLVVRETMNVVRPPVKDLEVFGHYIARRCKGFVTYRLVKTHSVFPSRRKQKHFQDRHLSDSQQLYNEHLNRQVRKHEERLRNKDRHPEELLSEGGLRDKRSADEVAPYEQNDSHFTVVEFAGKNIVEYTVIDE